MKLCIYFVAAALICLDFVLLVLLFADPWEQCRTDVAWMLTSVMPILAVLTCLFGRLCVARSRRTLWIVFVIALSVIASVVGDWALFICHI